MKINKKILNAIFACILLNIIPMFFLGLFKISSSLYTILNTMCYLVQSIVMFLCCIDKFNKISKKNALFMLFCSINCFIAIIYGLIKYNSISINDYLYTISLIYNIFIFIVCAEKFEVSDRSVYSFYKKMIYLGIISVIINIVLNYKYMLNLSIITNSYNLNFSSFFPNRNQFGLFMLIIIISNSILIQYEHKKKFKYLQIVFIMNLILSMSRNSLLGLCIYYFMLFYYQNIKGKIKFTKKKLLLYCMYLSLLIVGLIYCLNNTEIIKTINTLFFRIENIKTGSGRFDVWKNGIYIITNNDFLFGIGRFRGLELNKILFFNDLEHFHSMYVEKLVSHGIIGLLWLFLMLKNVWNRIKKSSLELELKNILLASFLSFCIFSIFETTTRFSIGYTDNIFLIYFFTIPLIISKKQNRVGDN